MDANFKITKERVAALMKPDQVHEDIRQLFTKIVEMTQKDNNEQ